MCAFGSAPVPADPRSISSRHVTERLQALGFRGIHAAWHRRPVLEGRSTHGGQGARQCPGDFSLCLEHVRALRRIVSNIVELRVRGLDVLPIAIPDGAELTPAEVEPPERALGVRGPARCRLRALEHRFHADTVQPGGRRYVGELEHRRCDIHVPHLLRDALACPDARARYNQRNAKGRVVDEDAVLRLAVLAEALTVIRGNDHERVLR